jgi:hypothetical protein
MIPNRTLVGATLLIVAPICIAALAPAPGGERQSLEGGGRLSATQVPALAARVCRAVAPDVRPGVFLVGYEPAFQRPAGGGAEWTAVCRGAGAEGAAPGRGDVVCRWDAATCRLEYVERAIPRAAPTGPPVPPRDAVRQAKRWVRGLEMVDGGDSLELARPPVRNSLAWVVHLRAGRRFATVRIALSGGALQSIRVV